MDIEPNLGNFVKISFNDRYTIDILRDDGLKDGRSMLCNPAYEIIVDSFKIILNLVLNYSCLSF